MRRKENRRSLYGRCIHLYGGHLVAVALLAAMAACVETRASGSAPVCGLGVEQLPQLNLLAVQTGRLEPGHTVCFALNMQKGEFVRASLAVAKEYVRLRVLEARTLKPLISTWAWDWETYGRPPAIVAFQAPASGVYVVELSEPVMSWSRPAGPFLLQVDEWLSAKKQAARGDDLKRDPRTTWLRAHASSVRSLDPADESFSDLGFLREELRGVRVVLLGEGSPGHGGGSEQSAKTRLVKYLHMELGFDVLAFEAGLFGTSVAWQALQTGEEPRSAFLKGAYRNAGLSDHVQPLIRYLASAARTDRPLELTGFDSEFSGSAPREFLLPSLRDVLARSGIDGPLADASSSLSRIFASIVDGSFQERRAQLLRAGEQSDLPQVLRTAAAQLEQIAGARDQMFWVQVIRSAAATAEAVLGQTPGALSRRRVRERQMAENLVWLANSYYPRRKIIIWGHTSHVMRNPEATTAGRQSGFTMGQGLWEALGDESFAIGMTSYAGAVGCVVCTEGMADFREDIAPDQDPGFELEELLNAAGHPLAWVNLRTGRAAKSWLSGAFLARPLGSATERAPWSEVLDALFFIRTQEPNRPVVEVPR